MNTPSQISNTARPAIEKKGASEAGILPTKGLSPDDQPILLRDKTNQLIAGIKLERIIATKDNVQIIGWSLGASNLALLCDEQDMFAKINWLPRQDVLDYFFVTTDVDAGFEITVINPKRGNYAVEWNLESHGEKTAFRFPLKINFQSTRNTGNKKNTDNTSKSLVESGVIGPPKIAIKFYIESALCIGDSLALIGWVDDRKNKISEIYIHDETSSSQFYPLNADGTTINLIRTFRPDVIQALTVKQESDELLGFVIWLPHNTKLLSTISVGFDTEALLCQKIEISNLDSEPNPIGNFLIHSGFAIRSLAEQFADHKVLMQLDELDADLLLRHGIDSFVSIDQSLILNGKGLIIIGWIAATPEDIQKMEIVGGKYMIDLKSSLVRVARSDLNEAFPWLKDSALGFAALIEDPALLANAKLKLHVKLRSTGRQSITFSPNVGDWSVFLSLINATYDYAPHVINLVRSSTAMQGLPSFNERMASVIRANFNLRYKDLPTHVDNAATTIMAIDYVFPLDKEGLLIFGWRYDPRNIPLSITVIEPDGKYCDISEKFFAVSRMDVSQSLKDRYPEITNLCGFVCHAELPTKSGELRAIHLDFGDKGDVWLKPPSTVNDINGIQLIKEILGTVPEVGNISGQLYALFDRALGAPIEAISASSRKHAKEINQRQFGIPPAKPRISVIVPLYGRYDFMRYQLAHFVDDPDFDNVDLVYVVDDPSIVIPALHMATGHHELFRKPFRVVWYGQNLGFSGANNVGARLARADILLLLNSDVIPIAQGWLSALRNALDVLPDAGAVGPLLQFGDNSVQHAGMKPKHDPYYPGFLLNIHPGKGSAWNKRDEPTQHPLITAACLMLRKADYEAVGGLDEGYIIGDFEDSDLCLKLRKRGQTLWLVPEAKLWHLERQSQNLDCTPGYRQLLTLFNGWRYRQRILNGELTNPEESAV